MIDGRPIRHDGEWAESEQAAADRQSASLAALALMLALVVVGLLLVRILRQESQVEDCLLSGRTNCAITCDLAN